MGLYRRRIVRFILGIAVFLAIVQILTTLHFSSIHNDEVLVNLPQKTRRNELQSSLHSVLEDSTIARTTQEFDLRNSRVSTSGFVVERVYFNIYIKIV